MTDIEYKVLYIRTIGVIVSCKTRNQFKVATEYFKLAVKSLNQIHSDMLFTQWLVKNKQLEDEAGVDWH